MTGFADVIASYLGEAKYNRIKGIKIGIAGAGGLGSNVAAHLVRSGFCKFVLADYDIVQLSNLNRQFYFACQVGMKKTQALIDNLKRINKDVQAESIDVLLDRDNIEEVFCCCDAVIEAFDDPECKAMLFERLGRQGILLVGASGIGGWGKAESIKVRWLNEKTAVVGDFVSEVSGQLPPMSPRVNIVAAMMADVVLEHFLKEA